MNEYFQSSDWARSLLRSASNLCVCILGDLILDVTVTGDTKRLSREAPIPVVDIANQRMGLGGAANVAKNLAGLGAKARLCGLVGADSDGLALRSLADSVGIDTAGVLVDAGRHTTRKTRLVSGQQQVARFDQEDHTCISRNLNGLEAALIAQVKQAIADSDVLVISDYGNGVLSPGVCQKVIRAAAEVPVIVDPNPQDWQPYAGATVIKPNFSEFTTYTGIQEMQHPEDEQVVHELLRSNGWDALVVTRGSQGMKLYESEGSAGLVVHAFRSLPQQVFDVTGAGDTVTAVMAAVLGCGEGLKDACWLANLAGGAKVRHLGTWAVTANALIREAERHESQVLHAAPILHERDAEAWAEALRREGNRLVFTNGCFDLIHAGHIDYLDQSKRLGDRLVVGLNSDNSIRRIKGPGRPLQALEQRAAVLSALRWVDAVVVFEEDTPERLIQRLKPDVLTKGGDYPHAADLPGASYVQEHGGEVVLIPVKYDSSTTSMVERIGMEAPQA
ncbi:MAG: D-glycero-beta-D-manno-heptose 1-phosphate adenylyltransferase [Planctomycetota bacterium]